MAVPLPRCHSGDNSHKMSRLISTPGFIRRGARATRRLSLFSKLLNFSSWNERRRESCPGESREERMGVCVCARGLVLFSRVLKMFSFKTNEQGKNSPLPLRLHASTTTALLLGNLHFLFMRLFIYFPAFTWGRRLFLLSRRFYFLHLGLFCCCVFFLGWIMDFIVTLFLFLVLYLFCLGLVGTSVIGSVWLRKNFFFSLAKIIIR